MSAHSHDHGVTAAGSHRWRLALVLCIGLVVLTVEVAGALWSGSLALLADAGHLLADIGGIALALFAVTMAQRPPTPRRTFGYQRFEILAAVVNALILFGVGGYIAFEAVRRLFSPPAGHDGTAAIALGLVASAGGAVSVWLLRGASKDSLNMRGAFLEAMADLLTSVAVVVSGVLIATTGFQRADSIAALAIGALIVPRTWSLLRQGVHVLMEATPEGLDLDEVRAHILGVPGVVDVHDLHAWTITSGAPMLSAHVVVDDHSVHAHGGDILDLLQACLAQDFHVVHTTFQIEPAAHEDHEVGGHG
ncbi:MAG: cation transporter [Chloroflexi bacterium]|nr:MAG: cation transporter [Chloroflexota bacterium]